MMFQAVREYFARPERPRSRRGRGRRLAALFTFEFVVVVAGVLVAQMLQERVTNARNRAEAEEAVARSRADAVNLVLISDYWLKFGPCLEDRVADIARVAAEGGTLDAARIGRPGLPVRSNVGWSESTTLMARRIHGQDFVTAHESLVRNAEILHREQESIARDWASFALLDPSFGRPSAPDRASVRLAAVQVRASIKLIITNARFLREQAARMGIRPQPGAVLEVSGAPVTRFVDECGMLRQWSAR